MSKCIKSSSLWKNNDSLSPVLFISYVVVSERRVEHEDIWKHCGECLRSETRIASKRVPQDITTPLKIYTETTYMLHVDVSSYSINKLMYVDELVVASLCSNNTWFVCKQILNRENPISNLIGQFRLLYVASVPSAVNECLAIYSGWYLNG